MTDAPPPSADKRRCRVSDVIGPGLGRMLPVEFALFTLDGVNALYLLAIRVAG